VSFGYDQRPIVQDFSTTIFRGDKVGVIGPNGAGKTTLLRIILGQLQPNAGAVRLGTNLQIAYFDQLRDTLDDEKTVQENVADGYDTVTVGGKPRHVVGYLRDFLFSAERARTSVRFLSGGERNRLLLARLFAKPANVIVLDEPTNDLDMETLEMLEDRLVQFDGTVLVVSHDREFLNNVVTSSIVFEDGGAREYVGGYDDWLRQRAERPSPSDNRECGASGKPLTSAQGHPPTAKKDQRRRLSYKEQQELASLPETIEQLEKDISAIHAAMADPAFYRQPGEQIARERSRLEEMETRLAAAYSRWAQLEEMAI
jgi:ATP-binding cassette subfamily F protein uup